VNDIDANIIGALRKEPFTFSGVWDDATGELPLPPGWTRSETPDGMVEYSVTWTAKSVTTKYSGHVAQFWILENELPRRVEIWYPITDRRLARRIARREHMRFTKIGKRYEMRKL